MRCSILQSLPKDQKKTSVVRRGGKMFDSTAQQTCVCCGLGVSTEIETAEVFSNVRAYKGERFEIWRCGACRSIHAATPADLNHYYRDYPFAHRTLRKTERRIYNRLLRRLKHFGLHRESSVLDYGCGSGLFVDFLREQGFSFAAGYDPYSSKYASANLLRQTYDCLTAQDVLEHEDDPLELLRRLHSLLNPGGILYVSTPNAAAIDLSRPSEFIHAVHQPYHRHVFSAVALMQAARQVGLESLQISRRHATDTWQPFVNWRFFREWLRTGDDTINAAFENPTWTALLRHLPKLLVFGFFGAWFPLSGDMTIVFQKTQLPAPCHR